MTRKMQITFNGEVFDIEIKKASDGEVYARVKGSGTGVWLPIFIIVRIAERKYNRIDTIIHKGKRYYIRFNDYWDKFYIGEYNSCGAWYPTDLTFLILEFL